MISPIYPSAKRIPNTPPIACAAGDRGHFVLLTVYRISAVRTVLHRNRSFLWIVFCFAMKISRNEARHGGGRKERSKNPESFGQNAECSEPLLRLTDSTKCPKQNGRHGMIVWFNVYLFCWKSSSKYIAKVHKNKTLCKIFFGIISYKYRRNGVADRKECLNDG